MSVQELKLVVSANYPLIFLVTPEEERVIPEVLDAVTPRPLYFWSVASGTVCITRKAGALTREVVDAGADPVSVLAWLDEGAPDDGVLVLGDYAPFMDDALVVRKLREAAMSIRTSRKSLVVMGVEAKVPASIDKLTRVIDWALPDLDMLIKTTSSYIASLERLNSTVGRANAVPINLNASEQRELAQAGQGMTKTEYRHAMTLAIKRHGALDARTARDVQREKAKLVKRTGLLETFEVDDGMGQVGGVDLLKRWVGRRALAFSDAARDYGLRAPKGMLLVGPPGCGKSSVSKCVAGELRLPLVRLDVGALFGGLVGESESNARTALRTVEAMAPCVLWLDEIEKGMSGMGSSNSSDGGTTARVFSTVLTWLSEKQSQVFVVATANDVSQLPPELLRKGRFDEIFAMDLPTQGERSEILAIHLARVKRDPAKFDMLEVAKASHGYSGAEIEAALHDAMFNAFAEGKEVSTQDVIESIQATVPMSVTAGERLEALRRWAKTRARPASTGQPTATAKPEVEAGPQASAASILFED